MKRGFPATEASAPLSPHFICTPCCLSVIEGSIPGLDH